MSGSENILNKEPEELMQLLLHAARQDVAPQAARERALLSVTSVALGAGVVSSAAALATPSSLAKATGWVVAKWLVAGLTSGILTLAVAEKVQQLGSQPAARTQVARAGTAHGARRAPRAIARQQPSLNPEGDVPATPEAVAPELPPVAELVSPQPALVPARGPSSASPAARSAELAGAPEPQNEPQAGPLTRELSLLEQARQALAQHEAPHALQLLNDYGARFPSGSLQAEAAALRVEAVGQAGNHALAQRLAQSFLAAYPASPLAVRVRALSESFRATASKP